MHISEKLGVVVRWAIISILLEESYVILNKPLGNQYQNKFTQKYTVK